MISKKLKDINLGEILCEDIYRTKDINNASKEIPIITKGTPLTKNTIQKLITIFGEDYKVNVFCDQKILIETNNYNQSNTLDTIVNDNITFEQAINIYKNTIFQQEIYNLTKERLLSVFSEINGVLQDFKTTHKLNDKKIISISNRLIKTLKVKNEDFNPTLIYLVELENWDQITFNHSFDVAIICLAFVSSFTNDIEEITSLFIGALVHDIGKFLYAKYNLNDMDYIIKKEGKLTEDEYQQIKKHVEVADFLKPYFNDFTQRYKENIIYAALEHHEKYSGFGYSKGKQGMEISNAGRIIALCDVYDALIRDRRYKNAIKPNIAMEQLRKWTETGYFDPALFNKFIRAFGKYPTGSVIKTNKGAGIVVDQSSNYQKPIVFFPDLGEINTQKDQSIIFFENLDE